MADPPSHFDRPGNVPAPLTPLVGREREVETVAALLGRDDVRLMTLTGPGGVGKTRLALEIAADRAGAFPDGVWFVSLAPISDPDLVGPTIARTLGVWETSDDLLVDRLQATVRDKRLLLVLDNLEHVVEAAPFVVELLAACPRLMVLATSRVRLRVSGEHEHVVPPLALAEQDTALAIDGVTKAAAVRLFIERAQEVRDDVGRTHENLRAVTAICRRLDGLPLAIELAAARVKVLPPTALLARLEKRLPLLTGGGRDLPARQQTMRDTIAWSYDLLLPEEQTLFRRLAVFVDGCTLEAAEAVGVPVGDPGIDVLEGVTSLVDKSLLREEDRPGEEPRYLLLETVREFALEHLQASGEEATIRMRHAAWCLALAEGTAPLLRGSEARAGFAGLEREHGNLRTALAWFEARGEGKALLRLAAALGYFWSISGHWTEGNAWLERALAADPQPSPARLEALENLGENAGYQGDIARAEAALREGLALARRLGAGVKVSSMLHALGAQRVDQGRYAEGEALLAESVAEARQAGDTYNEALSMAHLGAAAWGRVDHVEAVARLEAARTLAREARHPLPAAVASRYLGLNAAEAGDFARAAEWHREWLAYDPEAVHILARAALDVASLAAARGEAERAAQLFGAAAVLTAAIGFPPAWPERGAHERALSQARAALGDDAFAVAFDAGRRLPREHVLAEVEAVLDAAATSPPVSVPGASAAAHGLTPRELEVLRLVAAGRSNREIADTLFISVPTVKSHLTNVLGKLELPSRSAATAYAHTHGLL